LAAPAPMPPAGQSAPSLTPSDQRVISSSWLSVSASKPECLLRGHVSPALNPHRPQSKRFSARSPSAWKVAAMLDHPIRAEQVVSLVVKRRAYWHSAPASARFEFNFWWSIGDSNHGPPCLPAKWSAFQRLRQRLFASQGEQRLSTQSAIARRFFSG
jgi:hypothetical protein